MLCKNVGLCDTQPPAQDPPTCTVSREGRGKSFRLASATIGYQFTGTIAPNGDSTYL